MQKIICDFIVEALVVMRIPKQIYQYFVCLCYLASLNVHDDICEECIEGRICVPYSF